MSTTKDLAAFAAGLTLADVPDAAAANASLAIADSVGCVFAGNSTPRRSACFGRSWGPRAAPRAPASISVGDQDGGGVPPPCSTGPRRMHWTTTASALTVSGFVASPTLVRPSWPWPRPSRKPVDGSRLLEAFIARWEVESAIARGLGSYTTARAGTPPPRWGISAPPLPGRSCWAATPRDSVTPWGSSPPKPRGCEP